jgi:deoxyribose-phosphate aldolase
MEYPLVSFPHGNGPTKDKVLATKRAAGTSGKEVGLVVNTFKMQRSDWRHIKEGSIKSTMWLPREVAFSKSWLTTTT